MNRMNAISEIIVDQPTFVHECKVDLIDSMGDDLRVVDSARVSFDKQSSLDDKGELFQQDARLLAYLAKHEHWTPFGHVVATLRITCPVFVARQWMRSNVGATRNEVSRRYVDGNVQYFLPDELHSRPEGSIKQGCGAVHPHSASWIAQIETHFEEVDEFYHEMVRDGVAPEEARIVLPLAHMTSFYETGSLAYFARVCKLRLDLHAQTAIRELAILVRNAVRPIAPVAWESQMLVG